MIPFATLAVTALKMYEQGKIDLDEFKETLEALNKRSNQETLEHIERNENGL